MAEPTSGKEKNRRAAIAKKKEQQRLAILAAQKKQDEERLRLEQEKLAKTQVEQQAIAASQQKHQLVVDDLTKKMLGVCNKMWSQGKHRCYCEKYILHAPSSIKSDPSCSS